MKLRFHLTAIALLSTVLVTMRVAVAQNSARLEDIEVRVNGEPVHFVGTGPQEYRGRVLVPLRGVLEKLGAYVGWDAATRTVIATRGDMSIRLPIGSDY